MASSSTFGRIDTPRNGPISSAAIRPPVDFDHFDPYVVEELQPIYKRLRETCPIGFTEAQGGFWVVTKYEDINEMAHQPAAFSSRFVGVPRQTGFDDAVVPPLNLDPPDHGVVKRILAGPFLPKRVEQVYRPITLDIVTELIDGFAGRVGFDLSYDFARLVPTKVVCKILGVSEWLTDQFALWIHRQLGLPPSDPLQAEAGREIIEYFTAEIAARKQNPTDDLISYLLAAELEGRRLTEMEVALSCAEILLAGIETTWDMLAFSLLHLARTPDQQAQLREHPELLPTAREELLRAYAPVAIGRYVTADLDFKGCKIRAEEMVWLALLSANHDPDAFDDPDQVILDRQPNRHITFGVGIHRCLGSNLARMEMDVAIGEFLRRLPPFRLDPQGEIEWSTGQNMGPRRVPIVFGDTT